MKPNWRFYLRYFNIDLKSGSKEKIKRGSGRHSSMVQAPQVRGKAAGWLSRDYLPAIPFWGLSSCIPESC